MLFVFCLTTSLSAVQEKGSERANEPTVYHNEWETLRCC